MNKPYAVIVGVGQMGAVFGTAFLKSGMPVVPVIRGADTVKSAEDFPNPSAVVTAVSENSLSPVLKRLPDAWKKKTVLLQNELYPFIWKDAGIEDPTFMAVWFEKKAGTDIKEIIPSTIFGPLSELIVGILKRLDLTCIQLKTEKESAEALFKKNLYIYTVNICGLQYDVKTGDLVEDYRSYAEKIAKEVIAVQEAVFKIRFSEKELLRFLWDTLAAEPNHKCRGRVAGDRLARLLKHAEKNRIKTPWIDKIE